MGMAVEGPYILPNNIPHIVDSKIEAEVRLIFFPFAYR